MDDPRFVFWHSIEPGGASFGLAGVITEIGPAVFGADFAALQRLRAARSISPLASAIGVSREFLYRVLAGAEWIWPSGRRTRPPGSRLPDTPVTTLAAYTVGGHQFALVSYTDSAGGKCVAVDQEWGPGASVCDVEVSTKSLVNAGMTMASQTMGEGSRPCTARHTIASPASTRSCAAANGWTGRSTTIRGTGNATSPASPIASS
jgi:hypothetical protein